MSRSERSEVRVTAKAVITPGLGSLSGAKSAGPRRKERKGSTSRRGKAVAAQRSSATPRRRWEVSPASGRPSKARSPGSRSERRKKPESQSCDSPVAKRGAVTALGHNDTRGSPPGGGWERARQARRGDAQHDRVGRTRPPGGQGMRLAGCLPQFTGHGCGCVAGHVLCVAMQAA